MAEDNLMKRIQGPQISLSTEVDIIVGGIELEPVEELEEGNLYGLEVKGGRILIAPIASCNWNLNDLDGITADEFRQLAPEDVPLKDRAVNTFHFLNGATPHYFKQRLVECFERITN